MTTAFFMVYRQRVRRPRRVVIYLGSEVQLDHRPTKYEVN